MLFPYNRVLSCCADSRKEVQIRKLKKAWVVKKIQPAEFQKKLHRQFKKVHDVDLVERDGQVFLDILYQKPKSMVEYKKKDRRDSRNHQSMGDR